MATRSAKDTPLWQRRFLEEQRLPDSYLDAAERYFDPLAALIARRARGGPTFFLGLNGSQGSGKSTLSEYLCAALRQEYQLRAIALSLDDFYLTRAERQVLAEQVHPLLATRGVPGTHDIPLLEHTLDLLADESAGLVSVPRFDKSRDDRAEPQHWTQVAAPLDVVILEGWCLGARAEDPQALREPINDLEREEDPTGTWRRYSNEQLEKHYAPLYQRLDCWLMLAAPGFEQVLRWRSEQEEKLREAVDHRGQGLMSDAALRRFVAHFERYTRQCLRDLPEHVDVLFQLDSERRIISVRGLEVTA
jgi:D-glycerate 3-kinase